MAISDKYGQVKTERGIIGDDEPVFIVRAKDYFAMRVIDHYRVLCESYDADRNHIDAIDLAYERFEEWRIQHQSTIRVPGTYPGQIQ